VAEELSENKDNLNITLVTALQYASAIYYSLLHISKLYKYYVISLSVPMYRNTVNAINCFPESVSYLNNM